jgi:hypothetical protein
MILEFGTKAAHFPFWEYINGIFLAELPFVPRRLFFASQQRIAIT